MFNISMPKRTIVQSSLAAIASLLLVSWLRIRPIGIVFLLLFGFWFYKTRCNLRIVPPPELHTKYEHLTTRIRDWRQNKPTMFCAVASGCLGALAILGHLISGSTVVLVGLVLAAIVSTKYNFKIIKIEHKDFAWSEKLHHDAELDDEFMPDVNESNLFVLERASDLASLTLPSDDAEADDEKSDDIPSELLIPDSIPEIDENSTDDDDDLLPLLKKEKQAQAQERAPSEVMEFKKGHFKRDSSLSTTSSSSEESLSKRLHFPDHTAIDAAPSQRQLMPPPAQSSSLQGDQVTAGDIVTLAVAQTLLANSGKLLPSLVSGIVQWSMGGNAVASNPDTGPDVLDASANAATAAAAAKAASQRRVVTALDSSDESDFEILENDDFK